jgi:ketosteroid isomerase-like protein
MSTTTDVADRIFAAIEAGDADAVADIYADDAVIWHNNDGVEQTKEENMRVLRWLVRSTSRREYCAIRRFEIDGGFVQQHDLHVEFDDGRSAVLPACLVVQVDGDRITRIDEYLDSAGAAEAFASSSA